jgi:hypothetical protein
VRRDRIRQQKEETHREIFLKRNGCVDPHMNVGVLRLIAEKKKGNDVNKRRKPDSTSKNQRLNNDDTKLVPDCS